MSSYANLILSSHLPHSIWSTSPPSSLSCTQVPQAFIGVTARPRLHLQVLYLHEPCRSSTATFLAAVSQLVVHFKVYTPYLRTSWSSTFRAIAFDQAHRSPLHFSWSTFAYIVEVYIADSFIRLPHRFPRYKKSLHSLRMHTLCFEDNFSRGTK